MIDTKLARPDVTLILDSDGVIQRATPAMAMAGEQLDQWHGLPWAQTIDPATGGKVRDVIEDARRSGISSYFQVTQRLPSGRDVAMEYTTVPRGKTSGFVAIGKNIQSVTELQSRLLSAQQERERDYWKIREIESRYRLLFDTSTDAVFLIRAASRDVVEANLAASRIFGTTIGKAFAPDMPARDIAALETMLGRVREEGRAPGILVHLGEARAPVSLRASLMNAEAGSFFLVQASEFGASSDAKAPEKAVNHAAFSFEDLARRLPDGLVVCNGEGVVLRANRAFLDLIEAESENTVSGENLRRWMSRPGADAGVVLDMVRRHGAVRLLATALTGQFGRETEVEISAAGDTDASPDTFGLIVRDVTRRLAGESETHPAQPDINDLGKLSLQDLLRQSTEAIERSGIQVALERASGNRTLAAEILGLSRQSLHTKLNRYGFERLNGTGAKQMAGGAA